MMPEARNPMNDPNPGSGGMKGHYSVTNMVKIIDIVSKVSRNPAFDLLIQAVENSIDALGGLAGERYIRIYRTTLSGLPSLVIEDNGCGMGKAAMENYRDVTGTLKNWTGAAGFLGIGRFAYIVRARSGVYIETRDIDSSFGELAYTIVDKHADVEEITFYSEFRTHDAWKYYLMWKGENQIADLKHGTRILLWNVDADILVQLEDNGAQWITNQYGHLLDEIQIEFHGQRVLSRPPPYSWYKTITGENLTVDNRPVTGKIVLSKSPQQNYGVAIRAVNRTIQYTMFDLIGYEKLQPQIWGYIDVDSIITREMITAAKDEILDSPTKRELWRKMRDFLRVTLGEWEERLEARRRQKVKSSLKVLESRIHKTLKELEQELDPSPEEEPPHPELAEKDEEIPIEADGKFVCNCCGHLLDKKPDKTGVVTTREFLRTPCPHCGNPYKMKAHRSALGKEYRLYICKNCGHHILHIDRTRYGFNLEILKEWTYNPELEYVWENKLFINGVHNNFKEANMSTKKITNGKYWDRYITEKEIDNTPLELHIINCAANGYAVNQFGKTAELDKFILEVARFKSIYYRVRI